MNRLLAIIAILFLVGCKGDNTILWNDCVIYAANQKIVMDAKHQLNPAYKSKVLLVITKDNTVGHAYLIYIVNNTLFAYDDTGSRVVDIALKSIEDEPNLIALQLVGANLKKAKFA